MSNLIPIKERTSEELREMTRKGGKASGVARREKRDRIAAMIAAFKVKPLTKADADLIDRMLLLMSKEQLEVVAKNEDYPQDVRVRARLLIGDDEKAMEMAERMRDRVFGKPKQAVDVAVDNTPPASIIEVTMSEE